MELIKGNRTNPDILKQLGYSKLSRSTWVRDGIIVQVIRGRIYKLSKQVQYKRLI